MKNRLFQCLGFLPAIVVIVFVCISLIGYSKPIFKEVSKSDNQNSIIDNKQDDKQNKKNNDSRSTEEIKKSSILKNASKNKTYKDGIYTGTGKGFGGDINVQVTIKSGKIADIKILNHSDGTEFISKASSLLGVIKTKQSTNVDIVSGATYSSNGIIQAVRNALNKAIINSDDIESETVSISTANNQKSKNNPNNQTAPKITFVSENGTYKDGIYTGTGKGFGGDMKVQVTIKNSKISDIKILNHSDGSEFISKASSLFGIIKAKQSTNVDVVSGATFSSNGIIQAVRDALSKAKITSSDQSGSNANTKSDTKNKSSSDGVIKGKFPYKNGVYLGTGEGYKGEITVAVSITNKTIDTILVLNYHDDEQFFNRAKGLISTIIKKQTVEVDVVSGATFSSYGIIDAIKDALNNAKNPTKFEENDSSSKVDENPNDDEISDSSSEESSDAEYKYKDGTYTAFAVCVADDYNDFDSYNLYVSVTIKNDKIVSIKNVYGDGDFENDWYINRAVNGTSKYKGVVSQYVDSDGNIEIDAVSGATCSSHGIAQAVRNALEKAKNIGD